MFVLIFSIIDGVESPEFPLVAGILKEVGREEDGRLWIQPGACLG